MWTDGTQKGIKKLNPTEFDLIEGITSTWRLGPGALEFGTHSEMDAPVDAGNLHQWYIDARARYLYSVGSVAPSVGRALRNGDISGWFTLGGFLYNPSFPARPDNSGISLMRYQGHVEVSLFGDFVSARLDTDWFTDGHAANVLRPTELDITPEIVFEVEPLEFHVALESDMPLDRGGFTQSFAYVTLKYEFDSRETSPAKGTGH